MYRNADMASRRGRSGHRLSCLGPFVFSPEYHTSKPQASVPPPQQQQPSCDLATHSLTHSLTSSHIAPPTPPTRPPSPQSRPRNPPLSETGSTPGDRLCYSAP